MNTPKNLDLSDYIRLAIALVFLGLFAYQVITGAEVHPFIRDNLVVLIGFYFALDKIGDIAGKYTIARRNGQASHQKEKEGSDVT